VQTNTTYFTVTYNKQRVSS